MILAALILKAVLPSPSLIVPISLWAGYQRQQSLCREQVAQPYPAGTSLIMSSRCNFHIWIVSYSSRLLYVIQHRNTVLIDWRFSLAEQHLSRISICFFLKKKAGLIGFPVFPYLVISCWAVICFRVQTNVFWTGVCVRIFLRITETKKKALRQLSALPELSAGGAGDTTQEFFLLF